jgi:uncharacterized protein (DUF58 family)
MEESIVIAASACAELVQRGHRFSLHTIDETVTEGAGAGQLQSVLRALALLEIKRDSSPPGLRVSNAENRLLVSSTTIPPEIEARFDSVLATPQRAA